MKCTYEYAETCLTWAIQTVKAGKWLAAYNTILHLNASYLPQIVTKKQKHGSPCQRLPQRCGRGKELLSLGLWKWSQQVWSLAVSGNQQSPRVAWHVQKGKTLKKHHSSALSYIREETQWLFQEADDSKQHSLLHARVLGETTEKSDGNCLIGAVSQCATDLGEVTFSPRAPIPCSIRFIPYHIPH